MPGGTKNFIPTCLKKSTPISWSQLRIWWRNRGNKESNLKLIFKSVIFNLSSLLSRGRFRRLNFSSLWLKHFRYSWWSCSSCLVQSIWRLVSILQNLIKTVDELIVQRRQLRGGVQIEEQNRFGGQAYPYRRDESNQQYRPKELQEHQHGEEQITSEERWLGW